MFGYWATGRLRNATIPAIVMMIEITMATIGRLTKNFAIAFPRTLAGWCFLFRRPRLRISRTCLRLLVRLSREDHAGSHLLHSLDDHLFAFLQPCGDHHLPVITRPDLDRPNFRFVIRTQNSKLIVSLQVDQCPLGHY